MNKLADIGLFESLCPNSQSNLAVFNRADESGNPLNPEDWEDGQAVYQVDVTFGDSGGRETWVSVIPLTDPEDGDICYGVELGGYGGGWYGDCFFWDQETAREVADAVAERMKSGKSPWTWGGA